MGEKMVVSVRGGPARARLRSAGSAARLCGGLRDDALWGLCEQVTSPEQHSRWGKVFVTFLVRTEPQQYRVRRRYRCASASPPDRTGRASADRREDACSDFEWLKQSLEARFVGLVTPPLPGKRGIWGATSHVGRLSAQHPCEDSFVLERMRMLSLFADALIRNPYLRADDVCRRFLSENDGKGWDQFKKVRGGAMPLSERGGLRATRFTKRALAAAAGAQARRGGAHRGGAALAHAGQQHARGGGRGEVSATPNRQFIVPGRVGGKRIQPRAPCPAFLPWIQDDLGPVAAV